MKRYKRKFEESSAKKKDLKEGSVMFSNIKEASEAITDIITFIASKSSNEKLFIKLIADAIINGLFQSRDMGDEDLVEKDARMLCALIRSADYSSSFDM